MFRVGISGLKQFAARKFSTAAAALPESYSGGVKVMHWTMGGSMMACVGLVLLAQNTTDKKDKGNYMFYHKSFGLLAAGLLAPRLLLRVASKAPGPVVGSAAWEHTVARLTHYIMYGFIIGLPVTGVAMGATSGFGLPFFYTTIPSIEKKPEIAKQAYNIHKLLGQAFEYAVPLHVGGALQHAVRGHSIFPRILGSAGKKAAK